MTRAELIRLISTRLAMSFMACAGAFCLLAALGLFTSGPAAAQTPSVPAVRTTASPGTEAMLRRHIDSLQNGRIDFEDMGPGLEKAARDQQADALPRFQKLGALETLTFKGVGIGGADIYEAAFANGRVEFRMAPLQPDGKMGGLSYGVLPTQDEAAALKGRVAAGKPDPEREALLRQEIAGQQKGEILPQIRTPALTAAATQQWQSILENNKRLGKFISLQFLHVDQRGWDVYDATYENGHMIYRVGPLTDHKLNGLLGQG